MVGYSKGDWIGAGVFFALFMLLFAGCNTVAAHQEKKETAALMSKASKRAYEQSITKPKIHESLPSASPTPAKPRVHPSSLTIHLHPCTIQGEQVHDTDAPGGYFICGIAVDGELRWVDDVERARADAKAKSDAFWAEYEAKKAAEPDTSSSNSGYVGPRCYAPGGKTFRPC